MTPDRLLCRFGRWFAPLLAFLLPLATYLATMARGLVWGDGIELAAVCTTLGIAHPTGYPLFTMVGHLFTRLPFGTAIARVTFFCALSIACASYLLYQLLLRWIQSRRPTPADVSPPVLALAGALTFAWSLGPWSHATVTEVYAFELVIQLAVMDLAFCALHRGSRRTAGLLALVLGLGMTHHMLTLALFPFLIAAAREVARQPRFRTPASRVRLAARFGALFLAGLLPLLYLPLRAAQSPRLSWGDPSSPERLLRTLSGGDYLGERLLTEQPGAPFDPESLGQHLVLRLGDLATYLAAQILSPRVLPVWVWLVFLGLGAVLVGLGWRCLYRRQRVFTLAWSAALGLYLFVLLTYNIRDIRDYQLGFFGLLWPVLWIGLSEISALSPTASPGARRGTQSRRWSSWLVLALPFALLLANYPAADRSRGDLADVYASRLLVHLPRDAILLTDGDYNTATAWYLQEVEGQRPDVLVYCLDFLYQDWYQAYFERRDLGGRRVGVSSRSPTDAEGFVSELRRLVIDPNVDEFPVFMTPSRRQLRQLEKHYDMEYAARVMSDEEYGAALTGGFDPPQPRLFRIRSAVEPAP